MSNEGKRNDLPTASAGTEITTDTTHRARNRTVMLTPEMTGQMRAHMMEDDYSHEEPPRGGSDWENATPEKFGGRMIGHQAKAEEDNSDWTRPIEPATFSDDEEVGVGTTDDFQAGWQPGEASEETTSGNGHPGFSNGALVKEEHSLADPYARADQFLGRQGSQDYEPQPQEVQTKGPEAFAGHAPQPRGHIITGASSVPSGLRSVPHSVPHSAPHSAPNSDESMHDMRSYDVSSTSYAETNRPQNNEFEEDYHQGYHKKEVEMDLPEKITWKQESQLVGFLVTFDHTKNGSYIPLRTGRIIVTSESEGNGNVLLINDSSVSPMHAIMRVSGGPSVQVLDQLSESGTRIVRLADGQEEFLSGEKANLLHGDIVFFGDRKFHVCLIQGAVV